MGKPKNHNPDLCGLLIVDKPLTWSSMQVCRRVRRATSGAKVGHAGTLDPLATGIVICCIGKATRCVSALMDATKVYETDVDLTAFTNTDDREGEREVVHVDQPPTVADVKAALESFIGRIEQTPPMFSAIHINGERAYKLARRGDEVEMPTRMVRVDAIDLLGYEWPIVSLRITCGKGTYIRTIGRDLGTKLGTGGHLAMLRRTAVGCYDLSMAVNEERLESPITQADLLAAPEIPDRKRKR